MLTCIPDGLLEGFTSLPLSLNYVPPHGGDGELGAEQRETGGRWMARLMEREGRWGEE